MKLRSDLQYLVIQPPMLDINNDIICHISITQRITSFYDNNIVIKKINLTGREYNIIFYRGH